MKKQTFVFIAFTSMTILQSCELAVNKMAFYPDAKNVLSQDQLPSGVQEFFIETEDQVKIHSFFIPNKSSDKLLIYFHGNAGNICHRLPDLMKISSFGINVLGVSYRGYGKSQGKPTEKGIYNDGKATLNYATQRLGFSLYNITILGRSIGSAVAVNTAQKLNIGGLILVTPLTSGKEHAKFSGVGFLSFLAGNSFNNIEKIANISCPILIIHGTHDNIIPFEMGKKIYKNANSPKQFVKIDGANHNNLSTQYEDSYWPPIYAFMTK